ncbi:hypothetical protein C5C13_11795 [Clavibacter michiganensis]|nr:hypothetical protein C5C13_11795 [Clavibacter michiganensis]
MAGSDSKHVLLVDNHDSYTGNLFQLLWCETGNPPDVVQSDGIDFGTLDLAAYSHIVLGPGPGTPHNPADVGETTELLRRTDAFVLGVCFGLQSIAVALGGRVSRLSEPAHGTTSTILCDSSPLFDGLASQFDAVRYHSLEVQYPLPAPMRATAWTDDGVLMAAEAPALGLYGVQFHPESIGTDSGPRIVSNFLKVESQVVPRIRGALGQEVAINV